MDKPITAPHDAEAVYVCETDTTRTLRYPFHEGADIPRTIEKDGAVFTLRSVTYEASGFDVTRAAA